MVHWKDKSAKAMYIDRLGVNIRYAKKGTGSLTLSKAKEIVRMAGAEYLRLFVVDINEPAIRLYEKITFQRRREFIMKYLMMDLYYTNLDTK